MITIGLIGHSSRSGNLGVGALTVAEIAILRGICERLDVPLQIHILDWKMSTAPYVVGDDISIYEMGGADLIQPWGYFAAVRACDLIIDIGAGDSFADIYGPKRLAKMFWMKYLIHVARRPLVLGPQTYGPFTRRTTLPLVRGTVRRAAVVTSRDQLSTEAIHRLLPKIEVIEASDVALRLPLDADAPGPTDMPDAGDGTRPRIGLNVSGLLMSGGYTRDNMFGLRLDYPRMIENLIQRLLAHPERPEVHLVSHVISWSGTSIEDDRAPTIKLQERYPELIVAPAFRHPSAAKTYIAGLDFFAGARMHACIAAFSTGVPVVPMAYSRKFAGLFGSLGYDRTVDCTAEDDETVINAVVDGFENRARLAEEIAPALEAGMRKLAIYEAELEKVIAQLPGVTRAARRAAE